jgi:hypothetical protein
VLLHDAELLDERLVLPLVWSAAAFDEVVCKFVTGRWVHCSGCCMQGLRTKTGSILLSSRCCTSVNKPAVLININVQHKSACTVA